MIYQYNCKACGASLKKVRKIAERDNSTVCECGAIMVRAGTPPMSSSLMGAMEASKRDGVGCFIDRGQVCQPKTRGSKLSRIKNEQSN